MLLYRYSRVGSDLLKIPSYLIYYKDRKFMTSTFATSTSCVAFHHNRSTMLFDHHCTTRPYIPIKRSSYNYNNSSRNNNSRSRRCYCYPIITVLLLVVVIISMTIVVAANASIVLPKSIAFTIKRTTTRTKSSSFIVNTALLFQSTSSGDTTSSSTTSATTAATMNTGTGSCSDKVNPVPIIPPLSKTAKRIFWIRHGEVINPGASQNKSVFYGSMDVSLSEFGQQEAMAAGQFLSQQQQQQHTLGLSKVYSSNLTRAIYGAEQVLRFQQQQQEQQVDNIKTAPNEIIQVPGFMELNRGDWCGKTIQEIGSDAMKKFNRGDERVTPAHGESYRTFNDRVIFARNDIVLSQLELGQCAAVVSHLQVTRCIVADALQKPLEEISNIPIATASITCIDYEYVNTETNDTTVSEQQTDDRTLPKKQIIHFQSYKPDIGLRNSIDGAN